MISLSVLSMSSLQIPGMDRWYANPDDPALSVMTDFRERSSVTVRETATIDTALDHMKHTGVRCAFAIDESRRLVLGLITAYDILGERPMRHMQSMASKRQDVLVRDLMVPVAEWRVADVKDIERVKVADVSRLFDSSQLTHIPVMETQDNGARLLRGLLSAAKVKRLLTR